MILRQLTLAVCLSQGPQGCAFNRTGCAGTAQTEIVCAYFATQRVMPARLCSTIAPFTHEAELSALGTWGNAPDAFGRLANSR
jgi:hypothetical protein